MGEQKTLRITEEKARTLLKQCKYLLTTCIVACLLMAGLGYRFGMVGPFWIIFTIYWFAGVFYFIWLGRLAHGVRRSVIYYVGGTWLLAGIIYLFAHIIAFTYIKSAVNNAFPLSTVPDTLRT